MIFARKMEGGYGTMKQSNANFRVVIRPDSCWGRFASEDAGGEACDRCVEICPEAFEKPHPDRCARVRRGADLSKDLPAIRRAIDECPTGAIRMVGLK